MSTCWSAEQQRGDTPHPRSGAVAALHWTGYKKIPHVQGQRNPSKMVGPGAVVRRYPMSKGKWEAQQDGRRGKFTFRTKHHFLQRCSEGSNKPCAHQDPGTPQRQRQNCVWAFPVEVWVHSGLPQEQGLWVQQTWGWHKPSCRRSPLTPPQRCHNLHRTGK